MRWDAMPMINVNKAPSIGKKLETLEAASKQQNQYNARCVLKINKQNKPTDVIIIFFKSEKIKK